jgi:hypothetical protein
MMQASTTRGPRLLPARIVDSRESDSIRVDGVELKGKKGKRTRKLIQFCKTFSFSGIILVLVLVAGVVRTSQNLLDVTISRAYGKQSAVHSNSEAPLCHKSPYKDSLLPEASLETINEQAEKWLANSSAIETDLMARSNSTHNHVRFEAFQEMSPCNYECVGGACKSDQSKIVCGLQQLQAPCIVYSIGRLVLSCTTPVVCSCRAWWFYQKRQSHLGVGSLLVVQYRTRFSKNAR